MLGGGIITERTAQRIVIKAIRQEVLIVTEDDDTAHDIRIDIKSFIKSKMSIYLKISDSIDGISAAFMEMIYVMPLDRWNSKKRRKFGGLVLVTDESLKPQYIADGVKICRLPMIGE